MANAAPSQAKLHRVTEHPPFDRIALLLQGGGALGSYQAGAYQALAEANLEPEWVAGISIGAVNSALIAGNPPETRVGKAARILGGGQHSALGRSSPEIDRNR
jgi:NTE family protein